ncbi:glycosyl transferase [Sistotremastrum niveocremeum HHB9708]|uniref:Glycosyl transferase n=1 Tax=Sistotremastrum niveocremeum HHB9708 TaxID=1314777 RepID=A0A164RN24_9AGAM|nr:glycosyl transferase [Sistotremastrum niveocremeum HHB9708]
MHLILQSASETYRDSTKFPEWVDQVSDTYQDLYFSSPSSQCHVSSPKSTTNSTLSQTEDPKFSSPQSPPPRKANATLIMLARNKEIYQAISSVKHMEDRFNRALPSPYPWIFLNEEPFTEEFKERIRDVVSGEVEFGLIPKEHWFQPEDIDEKRAYRGRWELIMKGIIYADSVSYRNMCRFNSGFFYRHELLQKYKWYWRVEPNVKFFCDLDYDPFLFMEDNKKEYGFTITMEEFEPTIRSLWPTVKQFMADHPEYIAPDNAMKFISHNNGDTYNLCHFWSNFEIASLDFYRSEAYTSYFKTLDETGNFYYERWGDAPVHSIAASLFLNKSQIHFFSDVGYRHEPFQHCPQGVENERGKCSCDPDDNYDYTGASCLSRWEDVFR